MTFKQTKQKLQKGSAQSGINLAFGVALILSNGGCKIVLLPNYGREGGSVCVRRGRELKQNGKLGIQIKAGELLKRALCFSAKWNPHCVNGKNPHGVNGKKFVLEIASNVVQETFPFG